MVLDLYHTICFDRSFAGDGRVVTRNDVFKQACFLKVFTHVFIWRHEPNVALTESKLPQVYIYLKM